MRNGRPSGPGRTGGPRDERTAAPPRSDGKMTLLGGAWELKVALRYLTARRKQAFISLISGVAVVGVAVGVMALFIALGLMTGLQSEIRSRILGATAHVSVFAARGEPLEEYTPVVRRVRAVPGVAGAAPAMYGKVLLASTTSAAVATLKGIVPAEERTVTDVVAKVREAPLTSFEAPAAGPAPVLLGAALADGLNVGVGDVLTVTSPRGRLSPLGLLPRVTRVRVAGTVKTGLYEFDAGWGYMPLAAARRLFQDSDRTTLVE